MATERQTKRGFTLIELLVVIAIIAMLMSILMPSLSKVREQSRQVVCGTNLHATGQGLMIYAHNNHDLLIPGNYSVSWMTWANLQASYDYVNLGYLISTDALPVPQDEKNVLFCPSMKPNTTLQSAGEVYFDYDTFRECWEKNGYPAPVNYMFNTALDGFCSSVVSGSWAILSHQNRVQYLMTDGSVHSFKVVPLIYDISVGPELLQNVCQRYGVNFPSLLLHQWFAKGQIDLDEAKAYLANPSAWMAANANVALEETSNKIRLAQVKNTSLVSDVVGAWDVQGTGTPPQPG